MTLTYPFTEAQMNAAAKEWSCNCGPSALAFALQLPLESVRHAIPGFETKRYTSPTMMKAALKNLGHDYKPCCPPVYTKGKPLDVGKMFQDKPSLVRIQWTGPWTAPGTNPRWRYRATHWIATWKERGVALVFDCNGGINGVSSWIEEIVPLIVATIPRADGEWFPTDIWMVT